MYGFVNRCIELLVIRRFGEAAWRTIRKNAALPVDDSYSIIRVYEDRETFDLLAAASALLNVPVETVLIYFGEFYFEFCVEYGYDPILRALGSSPVEFLEGLDAMHDHLASTYPGMDAPTFRVTPKDPDDKNCFYLHYTSHRVGLHPIVKSLVPSAIKGIFDITVQMQQCEPNGTEQPGEIRFLVTIAAEDSSKKVQLGAANNVHAVDVDRFINKDTFSDLFPFHMVFDRNMNITQSGKGIYRILPQIESCRLFDLFYCHRPNRLQLNFGNILQQLNTAYVLKEKDFMPDHKRKSPLRLKGSMIFQWQHDVIVYYASPSAADFQDLLDQGLSLSDMALHDASRNYIEMSEKFAAEYEISLELEVMTHKLQSGYREVNAEKSKTDRLLYSVVPPEIVDDLRHQRTIPSRKYPEVTIMFTGIFGFQAFCESHDPMAIINLLNHCYTVFDRILDPPNHPNVYKIETVADHYLAVSGCPKEIPYHAKAICLLAIDIMDACKTGEFDVYDIKITVGINSGEIVSGIIGSSMPRYCLFGDCINMTSRTESNGKKGQINITEATYARLQTEINYIPDVVFSFFDNVPMKGKPKPVPVWLISRKTPEVAPNLGLQASSVPEPSDGVTQATVNGKSEYPTETVSLGEGKLSEAVVKASILARSRTSLGSLKEKPRNGNGPLITIKKTRFAAPFKKPDPCSQMCVII